MPRRPPNVILGLEITFDDTRRHLVDVRIVTLNHLVQVRILVRQLLEMLVKPRDIGEANLSTQVL